MYHAYDHDSASTPSSFQNCDRKGAATHVAHGHVKLLKDTHSHFTDEAVAEEVGAIERREAEAAMIEGYRASRDEQSEVARDWSSLDVEGWPA